MRDCFNVGRVFRDGLLSIVVDYRIPFDLIPIGRVLERHEGIRCRLLAFEKTREERPALLGNFRSADFGFISHRVDLL